MKTRVLRPNRQPAKKLSTLVEVVAGREVYALADPTINRIEFDSRNVGPGTLYVGLPGTKTHGAKFCEEAKQSGAVAMLTDQNGRESGLASGIPLIVVEDVRHAMAEVSVELFDRPAEKLQMFGITGTNGKTTTAFMVESAFHAAGKAIGNIGTLGFRLSQKSLESARTTITTPESSDLQAILAVMVEKEADSVVMEVSSHALALNRVDGICFDVAAFINLGRDHLDFHHTIENYFAAKAKLFTPEFSRQAVVSLDDPHGQILIDSIRKNSNQTLVTTGFDSSADYRILDWYPISQGGSQLSVRTPSGKLEFQIGLPGEYNVKNALTALAIGELAGIDTTSLLQGLAKAQVPGRMQKVDLAQIEEHMPPTVYVDFAHTPQAIQSALRAIQCPGKIICVLGAGGDRDATKREPMGQAGSEGADIVIVTDDNPRTEDPNAIRQAVLAGAKQVATGAKKVIDGGPRRQAIELALSLASPIDAIAVLGKGHEQGQIVGDKIYPFDDVTEVIRAWHKISAGEEDK